MRLFLYYILLSIIVDHSFKISFSFHISEYTNMHSRFQRKYPNTDILYLYNFF